MHDQKKLSVSEAFTAAGKAFYQRPVFCVGVFLFATLAGLVGAWLLTILQPEIVPSELVVFVAIAMTLSVGLVVFSKVLWLGFKKISLRLVRDSSTSFSDMTVTVHEGVRYVIGVLLFNIIVIGIPSAAILLAATGTGTDLMRVANSTAGSLSLAVIVGLGGYLALIFHLFPYVILDQNYGVVQSFHVAWSITEDGMFDLVIFYAIALLLNLIGAFVFMVGLLITIPITILAQAHVYQQLSKATFSFNG